jgi:hypothetical protein
MDSRDLTARVNVDMDDADGSHHAGQPPRKYPVGKLAVDVPRSIEPVSLRIARSG